MQIDALNTGADPVSVVRAIPTDDGEGIMVGINISDLSGLNGWWETAKKDPFGTFFSVCVDGATTYFTIKGIEDTYNNKKITAECPKK